MIHGHYSDGEMVTLDDGRTGVITRSLGHQIVKEDRRPDENRGPHYEVLINGKAMLHNGLTEWHGDAYVIVEEHVDGSLKPPGS